MKTLQNNFTSVEQSKRLLELEVPVWTADCYLDNNRPHIIQDEELYNLIKQGQYLPCWSVGKMIEICKICEPKKEYEQLFEELQYCQNYCVLIISHIIANSQIIDFSKLEE